MEKYFCAFDMAEEFMTETFASGRAADKTRNVRQDKFIEGAEIGFECSELIITHFCFGISKRIEKAWFAGIGKAYKSGARRDLKLNLKVPFFAVFAWSWFDRANVGWCFEMFITQPSPAAF